MEKTVRHPLFGDITYSRSRRARRITLSVRPPGRIRLSYPITVSRKAAEAFLEERTQWLERTLARIRQQWPATVMKPGQLVRGRKLVFEPSTAGTVKCRITPDGITIVYPETLSADSPQVQEASRKAAERVLVEEGRRIFPELVRPLADRHGLEYRSVTVRCARTRWGSCSARDDISLNAYLLLLPKHLIEYVIIHELCHTRHKDHSARFHALADELLGGNEKALRRELRSYRPGF